MSIKEAVSTIKGAKEAMENYYSAAKGNINNMMMQRKLKKLKEMKSDKEIKEMAKKKFKEQTGRDFYPDYNTLLSDDMKKMNKIMSELKK